jgi:hypothetical protein
MANLVQNIDSFAYDNLFAGHEIPVLVKGVTLEAGQGKLVRGTVLGKVTKAVGTVTGPDTANGTISAVTLGKSAKIGMYSLVCTTATDTGVAAVFKVVDPDGMILNDAVAGTAYAGPINFTITEVGGFDVGDTFTIPVIEGSGKYKVVNSANVDGSQVADCILADDADTASSDVTAVAYKTGYFNRNALVFGGTDTADIHEHTLRTLGIFLSENVKPVEA